jgi:sulfur-carrier protein adenylyltransferase/sulfurtransferase
LKESKIEEDLNMSITVRIPAPLQKLTEGRAEVEALGGNIRGLIDDLEKKFPGFKARICDEEGKTRKFINIYVNEEDVRFLQLDETPLKDGDEVSIIPAIAGGGGLSEEQIERYSRQILLPNVGGKGQEKLLNAKVLIIGAGGLGSPAALYLASAGIGKIGIVDSDKVEINNLQRQIVHSMKEVGKPKVESAKNRLNAINHDVDVIPYNLRVTSENITDIIKEYDIVIDGSDNFPTRYLVNDACVLSNKPLSHGGIFRFDGQAITILPRESACYRCLFPEPPPPGLVPSCQEAGILGAVAGIIGTIQANEVLKYILGVGNLLTGKLLVFNALDSSFRQVKVPKHPECPICGESPTVTKLIDYEYFCGLRK